MFLLTVTDEEYALIGADFIRTHQFLTILKAIPDTQDQKVIREALTLAAIVSYCRPFKTSHDADGQRRPWIPRELIDDLPPKYRNVHCRLVQARDQAWAHTDWTAHTPCSYQELDGVSSVSSRNPWVPLNKSEIAEFESLLREVDARIRPSSVVGRSN